MEEDDEIKRETSAIRDIRTFLAMLMRSDRKKRAKIEGLIDEDELKIIEATEGGSLAGEKYPLDKSHHEAFMRMKNMIDIIQQEWLGGRKELPEYQYLERLKENLFAQYYLRSHTSKTIAKPIAEAVSEYLGEPVETFKEPKEKKEEKKEEAKK